MSDLLQKIKLLIGKLKTGKISYERRAVKPMRDWRFILSVTFFILCILSIFAFYFYIKIDDGSFFTMTSDDAQNEIKINDVLLNKTVNDINARQTTNANIRNGSISIPSDPSI